jgi:predicted amidohydrolase YtcJ
VFNSKMARLMVQTVTLAVVLAVVATGCGHQPIGITPTNASKEPTNPPSVSTVTSQPPTTTPPIISEPPTLIFYNGTILTMDRDQPTAEAIAVAGDMILAVGSNDDILALQTSGTQLIDLQGLTLMPGFVDSHTHIFNDAASTPATGTLEKAQQLALQNGITTLADMYVTSDFLAEMRAMDASGQLRVRTSLYLVYTSNCGDVLGDWYKQYPPTRTPGEMLRIGGVKVFTDGGSCGYPAVSFNRAEGGYGNLFFTQDEMNTIVSDINKAGYQVAIHAIGDRAVEQALNAIEFALDGQPNTLRDRIEHNTTVRPDLIPRYQEIGAVATVFGNIWSCNDVFFSKGIIPDPSENQAWNFPYRALLDANPNAHFAWHSDYPWASPNPLFHLYSLVTPYEIAGDLSECADPSWVGNKTITVEEALPMMTIEGAFALFRDEEVGSLKPGKYADLIILSGNPTTDLKTIKNLKVWMTMVGGQVEWCAPGHEGLCPPSVGSEELPQSYSLRIKIRTTSDWTNFALVAGGKLVSASLVSTSQDAAYPWLGQGKFLLAQPLKQAERGQQIELVVDVLLTNVDANTMLRFEVERGYIGLTQVELFNNLGLSPVLIDTIEWGGIVSGGRNVLSVELPAAGYLVLPP